MDKDLANFVVEYLQKKGASYAEARMESRESSGFVLKNGNLEVSGFDENSGIGIRFIINGMMGFATTNKLDKESIKRSVDRSLSLTKDSSKIGERIILSDGKSVRDKYAVKQKDKVMDLDPKNKLKILTDLDKYLKKVDSRYLSLSDKVVKKFYVNSDGVSIFSEIPRINIYYFMNINYNKEIIQRGVQHGGVGGYEILKKWNLDEELPREIKALENNVKNSVKTPKGVLDVVCSPEITGIMVHESAGHPYEADRIAGREAAQAGESFVKEDMINSRIGSDCVTVVDDPGVEGSYGFYKYDDEGVLGRRKFIIQEGMIKEFMHDRSTSSQMKVLSNGSSRASIYNVEPLVRMSNTFMLPKDYSEEELINGVKNGVYIKSFMEWNIDDKRYNQKYVGCEAYLIKNGKIGKSVRSPALEITTPVLYSSIDAVGNNLQMFAGNCGKGEPMQGIPVWMGGPSIRLRRVRLV